MAAAGAVALSSPRAGSRGAGPFKRKNNLEEQSCPVYLYLSETKFINPGQSRCPLVAFHRLGKELMIFTVACEIPCACSECGDSLRDVELQLLPQNLSSLGFRWV